MSILTLNNVSLTLYKTCFQDFSAQLQAGDRIGIIGNNGVGKTMLLRILIGEVLPTTGKVHIPGELTIGYVPQLVEGHPNLSGAQRFQKVFSTAIAKQSDILVLDEPTNHLDSNNRASLIRFLQHFTGILVIATHDVDLLRKVATSIWHLEEGKIHIFHGTYDDYKRENEIKQQQKIQKIETLQRYKHQAQHAVMEERKRQHTSRKANQHENDRSLKGKMKDTGSRTAGRLEGKVLEHQKVINEELKNIRLPEVLQPKFNLPSHLIHRDRSIVSIKDGKIRYHNQGNWVLGNINLSILGGQRIAIMGHNGSGKSTILKALYGMKGVEKTGEWIMPFHEHISYLDQHYTTINPSNTVFQTIQIAVSHLDDRAIRQILNDFLFRKNEEVFKKTSCLSGGEKARLCVAQIAVNTPQILLLDEITNNIDQGTQQHLIQILQKYPGTLIVVSHDMHFLDQLQLDAIWSAEDWK